MLTRKAAPNLFYKTFSINFAKQCYLWRYKSTIYFFTNQIDIEKTKSMVLRGKVNKQLKKFKKDLLDKKSPLSIQQKNRDPYSEFHYRDIYKRINIQIESFFHKREFNIQNFNFLLNLIAEQSPEDYLQRLQEAIKKMDMLGIKPDQKSYNYMVKAAGKAHDPHQAQVFFREASQKFIPDVYLYTTLLQNYVINNDPEMGLKILQEMQEKEIQPDVAAYTTLINCFRKGRQLQKCWEVNRMLHKNLEKINKYKYKKMDSLKLVKDKPELLLHELDETYTGVMMKVYAATHDAQMAIKLYRQNIEKKGIKPMIETTNSYLMALSSRKQYANFVVDKVFSMVEANEMITSETINWALRACSINGNIKSAAQFLKIMKLKQFPVTKSTYNNLLRIYAKACLYPEQSQEIRDTIIADSWKLLQQMNKNNIQMDTYTLNNMLTVYANSINHQEIEGLILPLYQKYGLEYNSYTYQILIRMYFQLNDFNTALRVWKQMEKKLQQNQQNMLQKWHSEDERQLRKQTIKNHEAVRPTFQALHTYLDIGIKMLDMHQVLKALEMFKQMKRTPKNETLKFLGNLKDLPQQIRVSLMDFKIQFGEAKVSNVQLPNINDPQY